MVDRDAYVKMMKAKLDEWNAELDRLSAKAERASADAKLEYDRQIAAIRKQSEDAQRQLRDLQSASESAWEDLRAGMETAWDRMGSALKDAASRFK